MLFRVSISHSWTACVVALVLAWPLTAVPAHAQPGPTPQGPPSAASRPEPASEADDAGARQAQRSGLEDADALCNPWSCGVSEQARVRAAELHRQGIKLWQNSLLLDAVAAYREALRHWNHPAIHYNLALALRLLDRPIEAYQSVREALRYGSDPLEPYEYQQARELLEQLRRSRIAELHVTCAEPGATVTLNGRLLFQAPGEAKQLILPGTQQIEARKHGYLSAAKAVRVNPGSSMHVELRLIPEHQATRVHRPWPAALPWTILGAGVSVSAMGAILHLRSRQSYAEYMSQFRPLCASGCSGLPDEVQALYQRAREEQRLAFSGYSVGGLAVVSGVWMVYRNRPQIVENPAIGQQVRLSVTPLLAAETGGVAATLSF